MCLLFFLRSLRSFAAISSASRVAKRAETDAPDARPYRNSDWLTRTSLSLGGVFRPTDPELELADDELACIFSTTQSGLFGDPPRYARSDTEHHP